MKNMRKRQEAEKLLEEKLAEEQGVDYERMKNLNYTAEDVEKWEKIQQQKAERSSTGFVDYADANLKKHIKLTDKITPDLEAYKAIKSDKSQGALAADTIDYVNPVDFKPSVEAVDKVAKDMNEQMETRKKHSRRRAEDPDADISYINDRNMRFNKKIARYAYNTFI